MVRVAPPRTAPPARRPSRCRPRRNRLTAPPPRRADSSTQKQIRNFPAPFFSGKRMMISAHRAHPHTETL
ncbi:hypothetical protein EZV77_23705 [Burkholderia thailandensis]|nr:hypothetical protein CWD92_09140 [Burkholderia thailandensis]TBW57808.1 hypothetical protein EZV77_23705 [Burkholderia thailandensis]